MHVSLRQIALQRIGFATQPHLSTLTRSQQPPRDAPHSPSVKVATSVRLLHLDLSVARWGRGVQNGGREGFGPAVRRAGGGWLVHPRFLLWGGDGMLT